MAVSSMERTSTVLPYRECGVVLLASASIYIFLALISFSPSDAAWTQSGSRLIIENLVGASGAYTAYGLFYVLGITAFVLPFMMVGLTFHLLSRKAVEVDWVAFGTAATSIPFLLVATSVAAEIHLAGLLELPRGQGGIVGFSVVQASSAILGSVGTSLTAFTTILVSMQLAFSFSWLVVFEKTGQVLYYIGYKLVPTLTWLGSVLLAISVRVVRSVKAASPVSRQNEPFVYDRAPAPTVRFRKQKMTNRIEPTLQRIAKIAKPKEAEHSTVADVDGSAIDEKKTQKKISWTSMPSLDLLEDVEIHIARDEKRIQSLRALGQRLQENLMDFGVMVDVVSIVPGPVVTRFEINLAPGLKVSKITSLANDLAREMAVISVRVVPVIPGKSVVGIEIPNDERETVSLKEILASKVYTTSKAKLTLALGKNVSGDPVVANVERMPHLLVAGTTGSGKSVGVNAMLLSMLYRLTPDDVRFILVDPKMLELAVYDGIPHLLAPVVTDMQDAAKALNWCVNEMERRYQLMASFEVRNIAGFNQRLEEAATAGEELLDPLWSPTEGTEPAVLQKLPLIVVIIDEFADMIMIVGKKVEQLIARIAQKARAAGIHLVLATQRPSVDVITGLIKANIPCRMSYKVSSQVDSRTILDQMGAEQLLGHGDMLYLAPGTSVPERVHGAFVDDDDVLAVVADWKERGSPEYVTGLLDDAASPSQFDFDGANDADELYREAVSYVLESRKASISSVQRKLRIGYNRAARMIESMEAEGIVSAQNHNGSREVIVPEN